MIQQSYLNQLDKGYDHRCTNAYGRADHVSDYQSLFEKMDIHLEDENKDVICSELPIDQRLERLRAGQHDPELLSLYFQFGRYLLISVPGLKIAKSAMTRHMKAYKLFRPCGGVGNQTLGR